MDKLLLVGILENELKEMELDFGDDLSRKFSPLFELRN